jgi:hypothetical protein
MGFMRLHNALASERESLEDRGRRTRRSHTLGYQDLKPSGLRRDSSHNWIKSIPTCYLHVAVPLLSSLPSTYIP